MSSERDMKAATEAMEEGEKFAARLLERVSGVEACAFLASALEHVVRTCEPVGDDLPPTWRDEFAMETAAMIRDLLAIRKPSR